MKVALNIEYFCPSKGGGQTYAANFARALVARGHEVHVFACEAEDVSPEITFHRLDALRGPRALRDWGFVKASTLALHDQEFDIIQAFGLSLCMDVYRAGGGVHRKWFRMDLEAVSGELRRVAKRAMRTLSLRQAIKFGIEKRQYASSRLRRIIAVSEMVKRHIIECYDVPERKIAVICNGVNLERFHPSNREKFSQEVRNRFGIKDEIVVLCVANNFKLKGIRPLIKSMAMLDGQRKFVALIVGRDKQGPYVSLARQLGCEDRVIFAGGAPDVEQFYAAADIFVHPTFYDPCANVCLEALASGVPTITTRLNGSGEIITEGKEGFVIDTPKDIEAMAEFMRRLGDDEFRREAGRAARALAEEHSIERNVEDVMQVYHDVLEEKKAEGAEA